MAATTMDDSGERQLDTRLGAAVLTRRSFVAGIPLFLAACQSSSGPAVIPQASIASPALMYGPVPSEPFPIPAVNIARIEPVFYRQEVSVPAHIPNKPGTIVVDPADKFLYYVADGRTAVRYGVGVGREGFAWNGEARIGDKQEWPKWFPPKEMIARDPRLAPYDHGMDGGLNNPLGARAMYLYQGTKDTLFRIHGSNEPYTIGHAVSSGCIRMINQDAIDLYQRVAVGTTVTVLSA